MGSPEPPREDWQYTETPVHPNDPIRGKVIDLLNRAEGAVDEKILRLFDEQEARLNRLEQALRSLLDGMGVVLDDDRLGYIEVQLNRRDVEIAREALSAAGEDAK